MNPHVSILPKISCNEALRPLYLIGVEELIEMARLQLGQIGPAIAVTAQFNGLLEPLSHIQRLDFLLN